MKSLLFHIPEALGTLFGQQSLPVYAIIVSTPELKNKIISTLQHHSQLKWNGWETLCYMFLLAFLDLTVYNVQ